MKNESSKTYSGIIARNSIESRSNSDNLEGIVFRKRKTFSRTYNNLENETISPKTNINLF
jgi:hypothetical protein